MILGRLLCKLPKWLGGGHRWRRLTKAEVIIWNRDLINQSERDHIPYMRICRRCPAERIVKPRKKGEGK